MKDFINNVNRNIYGAEGKLNILGKFLKSFLIVIFISIAIYFINKVLDRSFRKYAEKNKTNRGVTLINISHKIIKTIFYFIGFVLIIDVFGFDTRSIIATAGIGGVAIGFGAQKLIKDLIAGFFIVIENQYCVGEWVKLDSHEGIVEELGLRVTRLRDFNGELHIIPNGSFDVVSNASRGFKRAFVSFDVAYKEDLDKVFEKLGEVNRRIKEKHRDAISMGPEILGVEELGASGVKITVSAMVKPMMFWAVKRGILKEVKSVFAKEGIEIPFMQIDLHQK